MSKEAKMKDKVHIKPFNIINGILFVIVCLIILVPIWKVLVDSLDLRTAYGMKLIPEKFGFDGYISVFTNKTLYRQMLVSLLTTVAGTFLGLTISTLCAYVLIQWELP